MTSLQTDPSCVRGSWVVATGTIVLAACGLASAPLTPASSAVGGTLQLLERQGSAAPDMGPVVVMLEPTGSTPQPEDSPRLFSIKSSTDRFAPSFFALAEGDYLVFMNEGAVSHRLFSADLDEDVQVPLGPESTSEPLRIDRQGELRFFCSLHPDEHFAGLVTDGPFSDVLAADGRYYIGPVPEGTYRLSIWSRSVKGPVRTVTVAAGNVLEEAIVLDPDLIPR